MSLRELRRGNLRARDLAGASLMTPRQALNTLIWFVLLPITIGIWVQFLPPLACSAALRSRSRPRRVPTTE